MEQRSGLRELQIVQSLVTLRWVGIPMLLGFGVLATQLLGMTFQIAPVYFLTCLLALMNVYFTIHVAMLSRQLMLHRGHASLKRFLMAVLNGFLLNLKTKGPRAFFALPLSSIRIFSSFYLLVLEALKGLRFNPLSLENVIHTQVIVDLLSITLFVRYTGSAESPVMILAVVPIIVAGAVLGFQKGLVYSVLSSGGYLILCLLINAKLMTHVKFYGPQFGDLSLSPGWSISNFLMLMMALLASSYLAHHLTSVFKERIFYLNQLLELNRRDSLAYSGVSQFVGNGWFLLTPEGVVVKYKQDRLCLIPENLSGKNILDAIPAFRQHGMAYILQAVVSNQKLKNVERVRIISSEGTSHIMSCKLLPILDSEKRPFVLLLTEDASEILYLKDLIEELKNNLDVAKIELGKVTVDSKDANNQLLKSLQLSNDRALEIDYLSQKIKAINVAKTQSDALSDAMTQELEKVKFANDSLREELQYKQMILEETSELLKNTHQLEVVSSMIERRSKTLFKLDNTCLHLFRSPPTASKMLEILDSQKEPSKLLDLPRKNPKVLEPVFSEGRPVVIRAEVRPDSAASVAISNGNCHRLVAYVPIRSGNEIIGMMMLDRYGPENNTEKMLEMLVYYLSHTAMTLKNSIVINDMKAQRQVLSATIGSLENRIDSLVDLIKFSPIDGEKPFQNFLGTLGKIFGSTAGLILRFHNDGSTECLARLDSSQCPKLEPFEEKIVKTIQENPSKKVIVQEKPGGPKLYGYPLSNGSRLNGVLLIQIAENQNYESGLIDVVAQLAKEHLSLLVLREERDLWENFYQTNLKE